MNEKHVGGQRRPLVSGVVLLGLGVYFMLMAYELVPGIDDSWPIILIIIGAALMIRGLIRR
jgi:hypothetical protein